MDIEKNIVFTVDETTTLEEVSEELSKLYKDSLKENFIYKTSEESKELGLQHSTTVGSIAKMDQTEVVLYVTCRAKKGETCCVIY